MIAEDILQSTKYKHKILILKITFVLSIDQDFLMIDNIKFGKFKFTSMYIVDIQFIKYSNIIYCCTSRNHSQARKKKYMSQVKR
jgi:hypothetical protein